jgi:hypothetical protein
MNTAKRKDLRPRAGELPGFVHAEGLAGLVDDATGLEAGSGTILSDDGPMAVSSRIVNAITDLGAEWCPMSKALMLTEDAKLRVRGWYAMPEDCWLPD